MSNPITRYQMVLGREEQAPYGLVPCEVEHPNGEWVKFEDAEAVRRELIAQTVQLREGLDEDDRAYQKLTENYIKLQKELELAGQSLAYQKFKIEGLQAQLALQVTKENNDEP